MRKTIPTILETEHFPEFDYFGLDDICVPITVDDFSRAVSHLKSAKIVGFDTESKPTFNKGEVNEGPHIVQFSTQSHAYIFQLHNPESHYPLMDLLSFKDVIKVGFDLGSDRKLLHRKFGVASLGLVDLCSEFKKQGYCNKVGIRAAVAIVLSQRFDKSKRISRSDWSCQVLSETQLLYAANDAYAALRIYLSMNETPLSF